MTAHTVNRACLAVELDGKPYFVNLPQDRMLQMLIPLAASLSDNNKLNVIAAPEGFRFMSLAEMKAGGA